MSTSIDPAENPDRYVRENKESLLRIIKHADDRFVRALCLAALVKYGDDPSKEEIMRDLENLDAIREGQ